MSWSKYICLEVLFYTSVSRLIRRASAIPQRWIRLLNWWPPPHPQPPPPNPRPLPNLIYPGVEICQVSARIEMVYIFLISKKLRFFFLILWIVLFTIDEKIAINRKITHFSIFLFNSERLYIWACKNTNFQTKWRRWKLFQ